MTLLNNYLRRKVNWVSHRLSRNFLLYDGIKGQITEVKGVGRRWTQLLDDLWHTRWNWELKEEAEVQKKKKAEKTVYQWNIRKKYKLSSTSPMDLLIRGIPNNRQDIRKCGKMITLWSNMWVQPHDECFTYKADMFSVVWRFMNVAVHLCTMYLIFFRCRHPQLLAQVVFLRHFRPDSDIH